MEFNRLLDTMEHFSMVQTLADEITEYYSNKNNVIFVCVLKGSVFFFTDLVRRTLVNPKLDFISASSYDGMNSTGELTIKSKPTLDYKDANVLLIDDVYETGTTIKTLVKYFKELGASEVKTCCLVNKSNDDYLDWYGFKLEKDKFLVGYGFDYDELYRNLENLYYIEKELI